MLSKLVAQEVALVAPVVSLECVWWSQLVVCRGKASLLSGFDAMNFEGRWLKQPEQLR